MGTGDMKLFFSILFATGVLSSCVAKQKSWTECKNWAAYMPAKFVTYEKSKNSCRLKKKDGWKKIANDDYISGEAGTDVVWKNYKLSDGNCDDCGPTGCA